MKVKLDITPNGVGIIYDNEETYVRDCYGGLPNEDMLRDLYNRLPEIEMETIIETEYIEYLGKLYLAQWRLGEYDSWNKPLVKFVHPDGLKTFWVGWYTHYDNFEFPFDYWCSGMRCDDNKSTMVSLIESSSEESVWELVGKYFSDYEERFCNEQEDSLENQYEKMDAGGRFVGGKRKGN